MGFSLSWLAIRGKPAEGVLDELGWRNTGEQEEFPESPTTCARMPTGWFSIVMQGRADAHDGTIDLRRLSKGAEAVTCFVEEHVMFSSASAWADGRQSWSVTHDSERGLRHLEVSGEPPSQISAVLKRRTAEQDAEGGDADAEVDFFFEVPVDLAESMTGYRYDQERIDGVALRFEVLERAPKAWLGGGGWFKSILGRGGGAG